MDEQGRCTKACLFIGGKDKTPALYQKGTKCSCNTFPEKRTTQQRICTDPIPGRHRKNGMRTEVRKASGQLGIVRGAEVGKRR